MKTNPWFSTDTLIVPKEAVYHDNTVCMEGDSIEKKYHRYGTDNRALCSQCARLDADGR